MLELLLVREIRQSPRESRSHPALIACASVEREKMRERGRGKRERKVNESKACADLAQYHLTS
jgi:hypothetical protein